jgi:hypothetical protein
MFLGQTDDVCPPAETVRAQLSHLPDGSHRWQSETVRQSYLLKLLVEIYTNHNSTTGFEIHPKGTL